MDLQKSGIIERLPNFGNFAEVVIPPATYRNQKASVHTVGAQTLLLCRKDLDKDLAYLVESALFDSLDKFSHVQEMKLHRMLDEAGLPEGITLHPGAKAFKRKEEKRLIIATGAIDGKYWNLGKTIQSLLEQRGIRTRVIRTDGSLENVRILTERPGLAIMQYDIALASHTDAPRRIYKKPLPAGIDIPPVSRLRRIAKLHEEKAHIIVSREKPNPQTDVRPTIDALKGLE